EHYTDKGNPHEGLPPWLWMRSRSSPAPDAMTVSAGQDQTLGDNPPHGDWEQTITLRPTGSRVLFAMAGPTRINFISAGYPRDLKLQFNPRDEVIQLQDEVQSALQYSVESTGTVGTPTS